LLGRDGRVMAGRGETPLVGIPNKGKIVNEKSYHNNRKEIARNFVTSLLGTGSQKKKKSNHHHKSAREGKADLYKDKKTV